MAISVIYEQVTDACPFSVAGATIDVVSIDRARRVIRMSKAKSGMGCAAVARCPGFARAHPGYGAACDATEFADVMKAHGRTLAS